MISFLKNLSPDRLFFLVALALFFLPFPLTLFRSDYPNLSFIERPQSGLRIKEKVMDWLGLPRDIVLDEMRFLNVSVRNPSLEEKGPPAPHEWNVALIEKPFLHAAPRPQHVRKTGEATGKKRVRLVQKGEAVGDKKLVFVGLVQTEREGEVKVVLKDVKSKRHHLLNKGEGIDGLKVEEVVFHTAVLVSEDGRRWTLTTRPGAFNRFLRGEE
ncbi:MAG: hypothetical protein MPW15_30055 (plasmid) [Candidatus Manganitrophus sp.]|nr:hypothetical protein [Candidatus Manganitrophus sp.]MDC4228363.1 hypothetical protein [Candidatus Manganitrophus sp.]WDT77983.1 MAG: hypothetical protein MPW16_21560 [Candidatus Manganitrophus sp.]